MFHGLPRPEGSKVKRKGRGNLTASKPARDPRSRVLQNEEDVESRSSDLATPSADL